MNVLILRPCGIQEGIDFDRVEQELLRPALRRLGLGRWVTGELPRSGELRQQQLALLLGAELILAELSLHHATILADRRTGAALRAKSTILLCGDAAAPSRAPETERLLRYDPENPAASLPPLLQVLGSALAAAAETPSCRARPGLAAPSSAVPDDFLQELERARDAGCQGDLDLLAEEVGGMAWELEGLCLIGRTRFSLAAERPAPPPAAPHLLLFTGHMIDQPDRAQPRFPADREAAARRAIAEAVAAERARVAGEVIGLAGGACGGDILFHELCRERGVASRIYLALPPEQYLVSSVQHGGAQWVERFHRLCRQLETRVLSASRELPRWLQPKANYNIWQRANLWMLFNALACGGHRVTLIALWDGRRGDGAGGTDDMVAQARARGARTIILDSKALFSLGTEKGDPR